MDENLIIQSNEVIMAEYDFNKIEKRIIYIIFNEVQKHANRFLAPKQEINLDENLYINFDPKQLCLAHNHITRAYNTLLNLRERTIQIINPITKSRIAVGIINYVEWDKKTDFLQVEISHKILPYLLYLTNNFTIYSCSVALSLKSLYSQRFYELCHRYKDKGYFLIEMEELRKILGVGRKFKQFTEFQKNILDIAQEELAQSMQEGESEVGFTWEPDRYNKQGKTFTSLSFCIQTRQSKNIHKQLAPIDFIYLISMDLGSFVLAKKQVEKILLFVSYAPSEVNYQILNSLHKIKNQYTEKEKAKKVLFKVLETEFKIKF